MNKLNLKTSQLRKPLRQPSPDLKNKNKICITLSPSAEVHSYLLSNLKKTRQEPTDDKQSKSLSFYQADSFQSSFNKEQMLRRRVQQLQRQNEEFKQYMIQCEVLVGRNKDLEEQMLLLLKELESKEDNQINSEYQMAADSHSNRKIGWANSTKNNRYHTTQQSQSDSHENHSIEDDKSHHHEEIKIVEPFDPIQIDSSLVIEQNAYIRAENEKIKQLVDKQIKSSIAVLQTKFMSHISAIQQKMAIMEATHQEICRLQLQPSIDSGSQESSLAGFEFKNLNKQQSSRSQFSQDNSSRHFPHSSEGGSSNSLPSFKKLEIADLAMQSTEQQRNQINEKTELNSQQSKRSEQSGERIRIRNKISQLNAEIAFLKKELQSTLDQSDYPMTPMKISTLYSSHSAEGYSSEFPLASAVEQTKTKLLKVIDIMRNFNEQYHSVLSSSRSRSLPLESKLNN